MTFVKTDLYLHYNLIKTKKMAVAHLKEITTQQSDHQFPLSHIVEIEIDMVFQYKSNELLVNEKLAEIVEKLRLREINPIDFMYDFYNLTNKKNNFYN